MYIECKNEDVFGSEQMHECKNDDKPQIDSQLSPYECAVFNNFELYNIHAKSAEIEKWSILNMEI